MPLMLHRPAYKSVEQRWQTPCDPRPLWLGRNLHDSTKDVLSWFPVTSPAKQLTIVHQLPSQAATLTSAEVRLKALHILACAEAERDEAAEQEAQRGLSFE